MQEPIIISEWTDGVAPSPHLGLGLVRALDVDSYPGSMKAGLDPVQTMHEISQVTFTADAATDLCTASGAVEANGAPFSGAAVYFTTTDTLPNGLSAATTYYLYRVSATTFKVCTSYKNSVGSAAGTVIDITDAGTGTHTMHAVAIGEVRHLVKDPRIGYVYMLDDNGRVWFSTNGTRSYLLNDSAIDTPSTGVTAASGNGLALSPFSSASATYLFVFRDALVDAIDVYGTTAIEALGWSNGWQSLNSAAADDSHRALAGQDAAIYFCDAGYVGSLIEVAGQTFDPANAATYTYANQALQLPPGETAECLEELDDRLLTGGLNTNLIYPWDRVSDSFDLPVRVPETKIFLMRNVGGTVYVAANHFGNVYAIEGSYVRKVARLPAHALNPDYTVASNPMTPKAIGETDGDILIGVTCVGTEGDGLWRVTPDGRVTMENYPSDGLGTPVTGILSDGRFYYMGFSGGCDSITAGNQRSSLGECVVESRLMRLATKHGKATLSKVEVGLADVTGNGSVRVRYRTDRTSSFAAFPNGEATLTMDGSSQTLSTEIGLNGIDRIQFEISVAGAIEPTDIILYP